MREHEIVRNDGSFDSASLLVIRFAADGPLTAKGVRECRRLT